MRTAVMVGCVLALLLFSFATVPVRANPGQDRSDPTPSECCPYDLSRGGAQGPWPLDAPPVANAGPDQQAFRNDLVTLDGSNSYDPDGDALYYRWTQVSGPPVNITGVNASVAEFLPTRLGTYSFRLTVDDSDADGWGIATKMVAPHWANASYSWTVLKDGGDAFIMWDIRDSYDGTGWPGESSVWVTNYTPEAGWGAEVNLAADNSDTATVKGLGLAMDPLGNAVALFLGCVQAGPEGDPECNFGGTNYVLGPGWWADGFSYWAPSEWIDESVAMGPSGHAFVAGTWVDSRYIPGVGWSGEWWGWPWGNASGLPRIEVDSGGGAVAMWSQDDGIWANHYNVGLGWDAPEYVGAGSTLYPLDFDFAVDSPGSDVVVWWQDDGIWAKHYSPGIGWGIPEYVGGYMLGGNRSAYARVAVDAVGNAASVWMEWNDSSEATGTSRYVPGLGWGAPEHLGVADGSDITDVAVDSSGIAVAAGWRADGIWANSHVPGLGWGIAQRFGTTGGAPYPIAVDPSGSVTAIWWQPDGVWANGFRPSFSSDTGTVTVLNRAPVADAGPDQTMDGTLTRVFLNGTGSYDPDAEPITYHWQQSAGPVIELQNATSPIADFWPPGLGVYSFDLFIGDPQGANVSDAVLVIVNVDGPPMAVAAASQSSGFIGTPIAFDATGSWDDVGVVSYLWDFGDSATDASATAVHAYAVRGTFTVRLTVWDTAGQTGNDSLTIRIENRAPMANASATVPPVYRGQTVVLDGTASYDPDGDPLTFSWRQFGGPNVTVTGASTATATFVPAEFGTYVFNLKVDDGFGGVAETSVTVTPLNRNPVAKAGPDQPAAGKNILLALDGTGSADPDSDPLTYAWAAPSGINLSDVSSPTPTFTATRSGAYTFFLQVGDGLGGTATDSVTVTVLNAAPVAIPRAPATAAKYAAATLDGSDSSDPDGDVLTYSWVQVSGPNVTVRSPNAAIADFASTMSGVYVFELTVDDGDAAGTDFALVTVVVSNTAPAADAGPDVLAQKGYRTRLSGSVLDADGDPLAILWSQVSGVPVTLSDTTTIVADFAAPSVGVYVFQLEATDNEGAGASDRITVTVWGLAPTAAVNANVTTGRAPASIRFDGSGSSDADGVIVDYAFDFGDGTPRLSGTNPVQTHVFSVAGTYRVSLLVTDDDGNRSAPATEQVSITMPVPADSEAPTIAIMSPQNGEVLSTGSITVTGTAWDDVEVVAVQVSLDNLTWLPAQGTTSWSAELVLDPGEIRIHAKALDATGNEGHASVTVSVSDAGNRPNSWSDEIVIGIIVIIGIIIVALWRLRVLWFPWFIMWCYTKLRRDEVLDNFARGEIYGFIRLNPGESYSDIKRSLGLAAGELTYHLAVLQRTGLVRSVADRARKLFYPTDVPVPQNGGDLRALQIRIVGILKEDPGIAVSDLAGLLGVSRHVALYHLRKLASADYVRLERRMARLRAYPAHATAVRRPSAGRE